MRPHPGASPKALPPPLVGEPLKGNTSRGTLPPSPGAQRTRHVTRRETDSETEAEGDAWVLLYFPLVCGFLIAEHFGNLGTYLVRIRA